MLISSRDCKMLALRRFALLEFAAHWRETITLFSEPFSQIYGFNQHNFKKTNNKKLLLAYLCGTDTPYKTEFYSLSQQD